MSVMVHIENATFQISGGAPDIQQEVARQIRQWFDLQAPIQSISVETRDPDPVRAKPPAPSIRVDKSPRAVGPLKQQVIDQIRRLRAGGMTYIEIDSVIGRDSSKGAASRAISVLGRGRVTEQMLERLRAI